MNTKNNQRFQETEKAIQQSLLELARSTPIRQVTVRAICEKTGVNRSTFYLHYLDINDLVDKMGQAMMNDIGQLMSDTDDPMDFFTSLPHLVKMITYVEEHRDFFDIYLNHYSQSANERFALLWERSAKPYIEGFGVSDETEMWYHFTFFKAGFLAVLSQWISSGCTESPEMLARILLKQPMRPDAAGGTARSSE